MILIYVAIAILALWGIGLRRSADLSAALSVDQSTMIKGVFVLLVFASHVGQYLDLPGGFLSTSYRIIRSNVGQLIVVPFLFFSGYGIRCSLIRKGDFYLLSIPRNRILRIYIHCVIILLAFFIVQLFLGKRYSSRHILLSFLFLESFGNSNWYLFAILLLYTATWFSFRFLQTPSRAVFLVLFCTVYCLVLSLFKDRYWYDTVFVYMFGLWFSDLEGSLSRLADRPSALIAVYAVLAAVVLLLTKFSYPHLLGGFLENVRAICFMLLLVLVLTRIRIGNSVLSWLGKHVFLCYLLQRLPMLVLDHFGLSNSSIPLFIICSAAATALLVPLFDKFLKRIDRRLFQT